MAKTRPDGRTKVFTNIIHWGRNHLNVRGLLAETEKGFWKVNDLARSALVSDLQPRGADKTKVESFVNGNDTLQSLLGQSWAAEVGQRNYAPKRQRKQKRIEKNNEDGAGAVGDTTNARLIKDSLLERLNQMEGYEFEQFVGRLLDSLGFRDTQVVGRAGDEGIDVVTYLASPFLSAKVVVQVKRHSANVGPRDISYLRDRWAHRADKLLFITTSDYTTGAREVAEDGREKEVDLVAGSQLVDVMLEHQLGVTATPVLSYTLDEDYLTNL